MRPSLVKKRWHEGRPVFCITIHLTDPSVAELVSLMGFECIWIDMEHHATSLETASQMMRAARVGRADILARPAKGEFMRMARMLEAGAQGILYPRCDNAAEAREVVRWAKFAPLGERGIDGGNPDMPYCMEDISKYVLSANEQTFIAAQIESPAAVEKARAIAEVEGIDMLFFGPADFSVLSGEPGRIRSDIGKRAAERICREALAAGKRFGTMAHDTEHARALIDMGASLICCSADLGLLKQGLEDLRRQFTKLGFSFGGEPAPTAGSSVGLRRAVAALEAEHVVAVPES